MPLPKEAVKWRMDDMAEELVLDDLFEFCDRLKAKYPETVFFDGRYMGGDEFRTLPRAARPARIFDSAAACFESLSVAEHNIFDKEPVKIFIARAPWPEEIAKGGDALIGSCRFPQDMRSAAEWHALGRYVRIKFPLNWPAFIPAAQWRFLRLDPLPDPASVGSAMMTRSGVSHTYLKADYQSNDPDSAGFIREVRSILGSLVTAQIAFYDPLDGKYLFPWKGNYRSLRSKRLIKMICTMPNHYVWLTTAQDGKICNDGQVAVLGPSPLFKEKVLKELGLPTDRIAGLAEVKAERVRKRKKAG